MGSSRIYNQHNVRPAARGISQPRHAPSGAARPSQEAARRGARTPHQLVPTTPRRVEQVPRLLARRKVATTGLRGSNNVLVPLTNSLYVSGQLTNTDRVLVDIGTGFLVEKDLKSAAKFYENKVTDLTNNLKDLETIVQRKQQNARTIEEVLRQKIMAQQQNQAQAQAA